MGDSMYTFFFDFKDVVYVSQVCGDTPKHAMLKWAHSLDVSTIRHMGPKMKEDLLSDLEDDYPNSISETCNVWSFAVVPLGRFGLINFVKTSIDSDVDARKRRLFTFIMNFQGGTYISQVRAVDHSHAVLNWGGSLEVDAIEGIDEVQKEKIISGLPSIAREPVGCVHNVWHFVLEVDGKKGEVYSVVTEDG